MLVFTRRVGPSGLAMATAGLLAFGALSARAAAVSVWAFPIPGSRFNRPTTQITFRGAPPGAIRRVTVVGSRSGKHSGRIKPDSDGQGASFVPDKRFATGETVTVSTGLTLSGAANGRFSFAIGDVAPLIPNGDLTGIAAGTSDGLMRFHSRPDLRPASLTVTNDAAPAREGDIFLAPQNGPLQDGPMIVDPRGQLVWFLPFPVARNTFVNDFRVQRLGGQSVLTWWQGFRNTGFGQSRGIGVIADRRYRKIATVRAANGLDAGSHEFLITPQGDAYITASSPVHVRGIRRTTIDSVVQEIDIHTGLVLFEWHALDHIPLSDSYPGPASVSGSYDPFHINSISVATDGNLLVSLRNTSAVYDIDHRSGRTLWTLGGKHSSFTMGHGTTTYLQHDAVAQPDGTLTIFDNGGWPPFVHPQSRGLHERLNLGAMTATLISECHHSPPLQAAVEGGMQMLSDGDAFLGWGPKAVFSEYSPAGAQIFDAHFNAAVASYRAYRFVWDAQPLTGPALTVSASLGATRRLYVSWNGATDVSAWRVLAGSRPGRLFPVTTAPKAGFETAILAHTSARYFAVEALGARGQVLSRSRTIATPTRHTISRRGG